MRGRGVQPRRGVAGVRGVRPIKGEEHFLRDVLRLALVAEDPIRDPDNADVFGPKQPLEGRW